MAAPGSPIRDFCARVCVQVRFTPDRAAISAELAAHLEDRVDALRERDPALTPEEAQARAVAAMGDPEAIGRALDQSHNPLLGWFQVWFRRAVWSLRPWSCWSACPRPFKRSPLWPPLPSSRIRPGWAISWPAMTSTT